MEIYEIMAQLNESNKTNHKIAVLTQHKDNKLLQRVLKMTYDKVAFTYGMSLEQVDKFEPTFTPDVTFESALDYIEDLICTRNITGHDALQAVSNLIGNLPADYAMVLRRIIFRDQRINLGRTQINKVWKNLIIKPVYMRCDVYGPKTKNNVKFPAYIQLKADGTYREFNVHNGHVTCRSRSGESYDYPLLFEQLSEFPDGVYIGELTVRNISDRAEGNGLINSSNPPHDDIILECWDYVTPEEYAKAGAKDKKNPCTTGYQQRFETLISTLKYLPDAFNIKLIPYKIANNLNEALQQVSEWMAYGYEGGVLKSMDGVFKDGTPKYQLKMKLAISLEVRCTGFNEGSKGTKREGKIGSIQFETDDGKIKGSCSGFSDKQLDFFTENQYNLLNKVFEVECNDLTRGRGNDYYALSHPRFIEFRDDKDETDTLEKAFKLREMAMEMK